MKLWFVPIFACLSSAVVAQDATRQPLLSDPITVADAFEAYHLAQDMYRADKDAELERATAHQGDLDTYVRAAPVLYDISWEYGDCTSPAGLIPPPPDGWGIPNAAFPFSWPGEAENLWLTYFTYDPEPLPGTDAFSETERSLRISATRSPSQLQMLGMMLSSDAMREQMLVEGPYGYPVGKHDGGMVFGDIHVTVDGSDEVVVQDMMAEIIGCAISNDMVAEGIDPATLRAEP